MDLSLYRSILHQLFTLGLQDIEIRFFLSGEPLIAGRNLIQMLSLADKLGFKNTLIHTNGTLLHKYADQILNAGLGKLSVSVDGIDKETYESVRVKGNFETVINNSKYFVNKAKNTRTKTVIQAIINHNGNKAYVEEKLKELIPGADFYYVRHPHNWNTADEITGSGTFREKTTECFPSENLSIYADGRIPVCCADLNGDYILADAIKEPLLDVWINKLGSIRERMKKLEPIPELCDKCERYGKTEAAGKNRGAAIEKNFDAAGKLAEAEKLIREGDLIGAKELLIVLKKKTENINILIDLSVVNIMLEKYEEASADLNAALRLEPWNEIVLENLAYLNQLVNQS
jgi:MoaA/NifB/PqqE/SkfB family radical SAM enzyme